MSSSKIAISMESGMLAEVDALVKKRMFPNRSRAIQDAVREKLDRLSHELLAHECANLNPTRGHEQAGHRPVLILNPVRAGMVEDAAAYRWSSHRAYIGKESLPWLTAGWVLGRFGDQAGEAIRRYSFFVADGASVVAKNFQRGEKDVRILGDDVFAEKVLAGQGEGGVSISLDDCIHVVCERYELTEADLAVKGQRRKPSEARAVIGWVARQNGGITLSEIARRFGRDVATVSLSVRRLQDRAARDEKLEGRLRLIFDECQDAKA